MYHNMDNTDNVNNVISALGLFKGGGYKKNILSILNVVLLVSLLSYYDVVIVVKLGHSLALRHELYYVYYVYYVQLNRSFKY